VDVLDYIAIGVQPGVTVDLSQLDELACDQIIRQYLERGDRPPRAILLGEIDWLVTGDVDAARRHQPDHDCAACRAGHDQAVAFLAEHPDARLALGNLSYREVW
jgi:hypothetical protein